MINSWNLCADCQDSSADCILCHQDGWQGDDSNDDWKCRPYDGAGESQFCDRAVSVPMCMCHCIVIHRLGFSLPSRILNIVGIALLVVVVLPAIVCVTLSLRRRRSNKQIKL